MARFNIQNFVSELNRSGTLQTNKFEVFFTSPLIMQNVNIDGNSTTDTERLLNLRAESVKVPGIGLLMSDVNRYGVGPMQKMPYNAAFTSNAITFLADRTNSIHKYFYTWMTSIFDSTGTSPDPNSTQFNVAASYKTEYKDNYTTDLHVKIYDVAGEQVQEIIMYRAFPEALNDLNLNWNDNNNLMKVTVSFSFRDWAMLNLKNTTNGSSRVPTYDAGKVSAWEGRPVPSYIPGTNALITGSNTNKLPAKQESVGPIPMTENGPQYTGGA